MSKYLRQLSKEILSGVEEGLTKVKFAKIIYFVHKELIRAGLSDTSDLSFIRMPLGPVPDGFMELVNEAWLSHKEQETRLAFNKHVYTINDGEIVPTTPYFNEIKKVVVGLAGLRTSTLVELSHLDNSWLNHRNGDVYTVSLEDLTNELEPLPEEDRKINEDRLVQSLYVRGAIDDMVVGSTDLEYPGYDV